VATYTRERAGMSAFALEDGVVYHTYSAYERGLDGLWGMQLKDKFAVSGGRTNLASAYVVARCKRRRLRCRS
jgi:predicted dithiol-disulfide oxidoreductase (DUF899 family)